MEQRTGLGSDRASSDASGGDGVSSHRAEEAGRRDRSGVEVDRRIEHGHITFELYSIAFTSFAGCIVRRDRTRANIRFEYIRCTTH